MSLDLNGWSKSHNLTHPPENCHLLRSVERHLIHGRCVVVDLQDEVVDLLRSVSPFAIRCVRKQTLAEEGMHVCPSKGRNGRINHCPQTLGANTVRSEEVMTIVDPFV